MPKREEVEEMKTTCIAPYKSSMAAKVILVAMVGSRVMVGGRAMVGG